MRFSIDKKPDSVFPLWVLSFTERKIGSNLVKASKIALLSGKLLAQSRSDAAHAALLKQASDAQVRTPRAVSASPLLRCVVLWVSIGRRPGQQYVVRAPLAVPRRPPRPQVSAPRGPRRQPGSLWVYTGSCSACACAFSSVLLKFPMGFDREWSSSTSL